MTIFLIIIAAMLAFFLTVSLLINLFFWYERLNEPCSELNPLKPDFANIIGLFFRFLTSHLYRYYSMLMWGLREKRGKSLTDKNVGKNDPVILVHGLYDRSSAWYRIKPALEKAGYPVFCFGYKSFGEDINEKMEKFNTFIKEKERQYPGQKFYLLGHSLGGIILRGWLSDKKNEEKTHSLMTLGSPHKGTKLIVFTAGKLAKDILPNSSYLNELNRKDQPKIPCIAYASGSDDMILPASALLPPDGWSLKIVTPADHIGVLYKKSTIKLLLEDLRKLSDTSQDNF